MTYLGLCRPPSECGMGRFGLTITHTTEPTMNILTRKFTAGVSLLAIAGPLTVSGFAQAAKAPVTAPKTAEVTSLA